MKIIKNTLLGFGLLSISVQSMAAIVQISGNTVDFVYDTDLIDSLFGTLSVSGDSIFATPIDFKASSTNGVGVNTGTAIDLINAIGTIQVVVKDGYSFTGISVGEGGKYNITGGGSVSVDASLRLFDWDYPAPVFGTEEKVVLTSTTIFTTNDGNDHQWTASGGFDMTTPLWDGVTHVGLTLDNTLRAISGSGDSAFIDKSAVGAVGFTIETAVIPVPAAIWLFGSGLLGLMGVARKRA
ncbi:MAG: hypothetical protein GQ550_05570 [Gammaproteobacteria bacterium]|nr:hypothetical protein [Gammaproteobacteria bacterium]